MIALLFCYFGLPQLPVMNASTQAVHCCQVMASASNIPLARQKNPEVAVSDRFMRVGKG